MAQKNEKSIVNKDYYRTYFGSLTTTATISTPSPLLRITLSVRWRYKNNIFASVRLSSRASLAERVISVSSAEIPFKSKETEFVPHFCVALRLYSVDLTLAIGITSSFFSHSHRFNWPYINVAVLHK